MALLGHKQKTLLINNATMVRKKSNKTVGRASAFTGEKLDWLLSWEDDFRTMERGKFYDEVSKTFLTCYGYDLPVEGNIPGTIEEWEPKNRKEGLVGEELAKENDFQENERKALRSVRHFS